MRQERIIFGAGPIPGLTGQLFVIFVQPSEPGADMFYADSIAQAISDVRSAYPDDRLIFLPPFGKPPPDLDLSAETADIVVSDLAELVDAETYGRITDNGLMRRLCRAGLDFVRTRPWEAQGLLFAEIAGAEFGEAEVAVAQPTPEGVGFTLYPGRGAFEKMAQSEASALLVGDILALSIKPLPEWAAPAARAVYGQAVVPEPVRIKAGIMAPVENADAAVLAAAAAAITAAGEGQAGGVRIRVRRWPS